MSINSAVVSAELHPVFWYGLPHGYLELDLNPSPAGLEDLALQIRSLPEEIRGRADQVFRLYASVVLMLQSQPVATCALGMHPDEHGNPSLSVVTISAVPSAGASPKLVLAEMLTAGGAVGTDPGIRPVELPVGTGFLFERVRKTVAPGSPPEGAEEPLLGTVWQGTVAVPDPRTSSIITVQLVTAAVDLANDYRGVLLGMARTLTFTAPADLMPTSGRSRAGSAELAMRNDFG
ncbi:hypothetical protein ABZT17_30670 [Streptomyces sp. NPDC005648]|uniref:hypothetical protein n=1 Tax=Streptomyces sp. NPDC005648 TaxID=3157044 RepID=UPI0033A719B4